jgi:hypothetical protein
MMFVACLVAVWRMAEEGIWQAAEEGRKKARQEAYDRETRLRRVG